MLNHYAVAGVVILGIVLGISCQEWECPVGSDNLAVTCDTGAATSSSPVCSEAVCCEGEK